jgi:uncharacterized membrane protein YsdA (DUF1294 family)
MRDADQLPLAGGINVHMTKTETAGSGEVRVMHNQRMLRIWSQALLLVALLFAAAGLIHGQRTRAWQISNRTYAILLTASLLGAVGSLLALIGAALE